MRKSEDKFQVAESNGNPVVDKPNGGPYHLSIVNSSAVSEAARLLGQRSTPKKARAARENGKLGGRPKKNSRKKVKAA